MKPRPGRGQRTNRGTTAIGGNPTGVPISFPAPNGGLVTNYDVLNPQSGSASVLLNMWPTLKGARVRGGSVRRALLDGGDNVKAAFNYRFGGAEKLFVATEAGIFDVTSPAAPPATTAASLTGMTSGDWTTIQHTTQGASMLVAVNGSDPRQLFNGSGWTTAPAITFTDGTTTNQFNYVWLFKNREFFIKAGSMDAYYLPLNSFGGAATVFPLGGVMRKGGSLLTGFSWSVESGDGLNDMCVFVSTEGEVAVYKGDDPSNINSFALVGVYQIGRPLGKNAWIRAGADVLLATVDGLMPISQVFQRDREALSLVSVSRPIEDDWRAAASAAPDGWTITQWQHRNLVFITYPRNLLVEDRCFVLNVLTGRWGIITNWSATCFGTLQQSLFFGTDNGIVWQGDSSGADDGEPFQAAYLSQFIAGDSVGQQKTATLARMMINSQSRPNVMLFARADMEKTVPLNPVVSTGNEQSAEWDVGLWDQARWDGTSFRNDYWFRQNVRATGNVLALGCVVTSFGIVPIDVEVGLGILQVAVGENSA